MNLAFGGGRHGSTQNQCCIARFQATASNRHRSAPSSLPSASRQHRPTLRGGLCSHTVMATTRRRAPSWPRAQQG